ncbi:hypothetical protein V8G54_014501 [Vigna mungo]|uniref:Uncharacterized protein n=1 Tax=Vigna mungo TaxID=3915 RepID=A0AAQ3NHM9_VIGMU
MASQLCWTTSIFRNFRGSLQLLDHLIMWLLLQGSQKMGVEHHLGGHYSPLYLSFLQHMLMMMLPCLCFLMPMRNSRNCKNSCVSCSLAVALPSNIVGDNQGINQIQQIHCFSPSF